MARARRHFIEPPDFDIPPPPKNNWDHEEKPQRRAYVYPKILTRYISVQEMCLELHLRYRDNRVG